MGAVQALAPVGLGALAGPIVERVKLQLHQVMGLPAVLSRGRKYWILSANRVQAHFRRV